MQYRCLELLEDSNACQILVDETVYSGVTKFVAYQTNFDFVIIFIIGLIIFFLLSRLILLFVDKFLLPDTDFEAIEDTKLAIKLHRNRLAYNEAKLLNLQNEVSK